jgi:2-amino-4-hydroxy-6-hydroxymethyldihydropteridine diphosphokinase
MIVALGGNQQSQVGDPDITLRKAIESVSDKGAVIRAVSPFYNTPCFPAGAGPDYVNAVMCLEADWSPEQTLAHLHAVEQTFGRQRDTRWGQRTLDLDLLAIDAKVAPDLTTFDAWYSLDVEVQKIKAPDTLILPHPRMQDRAFVLVPMADVAPEWRHPVLGKTVLEMLAALPASLKDEVKPRE